MNKIISELPKYVFENKFDEFYFFDFDSVFFDNHESFAKSIKAFLQLNNINRVFIDEYGEDVNSSFSISTDDIDSTLFKYTINVNDVRPGDIEYLHSIAPFPIIYSEDKTWCVFFDRVIELGVFGIMYEVSDNFKKSFTNNELFCKSINDYFSWLREVYSHRPKETEDFISEFKKNYNLRL